MQLISAHDGQLQTLETAKLHADRGRSFTTGLPAIDALAPEGGLARGVVHEVLTEPADGHAMFFAALLARSTADSADADETGVFIWSDPQSHLYPPALVALGVPLDRLLLLRPQTPEDEIWALAECLRCKGVCAVVAAVSALSRIQARRLQLAAESGGSVGLLLRHTGRSSAHYAAATRWLVKPAPGLRTVQRWSVQLIHGHGGRLFTSVTLEACRETGNVRAKDPVRPAAQLADRPDQKKSSRATA